MQISTAAAGQSLADPTPDLRGPALHLLDCAALRAPRPKATVARAVPCCPYRGASRTTRGIFVSSACPSTSWSISS